MTPELTDCYAKAIMHSDECVRFWTARAVEERDAARRYMGTARSAIGHECALTVDAYRTVHARSIVEWLETVNPDLAEMACAEV